MVGRSPGGADVPLGPGRHVKDTSIAGQVQCQCLTRDPHFADAEIIHHHYGCGASRNEIVSNSPSDPVNATTAW